MRQPILGPLAQLEEPSAHNGEVVGAYPTGSIASCGGFVTTRILGRFLRYLLSIYYYAMCHTVIGVIRTLKSGEEATHYHMSIGVEPYHSSSNNLGGVRGFDWQGE